MPMLSQAQNRAMHAAAEGRSNIGIPKSVGQDFVTASHGENVKALPQRKGPSDPPAPKPHRVASSLEAMTGLRPGKKIRRGGGRHKPKAASPQQHLQNVQQHLQAGNHQAAKSSAFQLVRALHSLAGPKQPAQPAQPAQQPPAGAQQALQQSDPAVLG